jgi:hypothetical protein
MGFVKLDCGILDSTLWVDREAREVFITGLLMAEPYELMKEEAQIEVGAIKETGFKVPLGWYGRVNGSGPGIVRRSGLEQEVGMAALVRLGEPDRESRSSEYEGRRMVRVDGGYLILNYIKYRERDLTSAERSKRWRERVKKKALGLSDEPGPEPFRNAKGKVVRGKGGRAAGTPAAEYEAQKWAQQFDSRGTDETEGIVYAKKEGGGAGDGVVRAGGVGAAVSVQGDGERCDAGVPDEGEGGGMGGIGGAEKGERVEEAEAAEAVSGYSLGDKLKGAG